MIVVTIANQKGGVGKTTSTLNLGVAVARTGKRVLLIDGDPQGNLTSYLGVTPGRPPHENIRTLDEIYLSKRPLDADTKAQFLVRTGAGVDLIASDATLAGVEYYLFNRPSRELVLAHFLSVVRADYDWVFIDTPPSLNLLTLNALCASRWVLVPMQPEFFSMEGVVKIRGTIDDLRKRFNPDLEILGLLPTQVSTRRKLTQEVLGMLRGEFGGLIFANMIHENAAIAESSGHARPVLDYSRSSLGAKDYQAAAQELLDRAGRGYHPTHENSSRTQSI